MSCGVAAQRDSTSCRELANSGLQLSKADHLLVAFYSAFTKIPCSGFLLFHGGHCRGLGVANNNSGIPSSEKAIQYSYVEDNMR
jgi:hypothetical protein